MILLNLMILFNFLIDIYEIRSYVKHKRLNEKMIGKKLYMILFNSFLFYLFIIIIKIYVLVFFIIFFKLIKVYLITKDIYIYEMIIEKYNFYMKKGQKEDVYFYDKQTVNNLFESLEKTLRNKFSNTMYYYYMGFIIIIFIGMVFYRLMYYF